MAVAFTSDTDKTPATASSFTYTSFAVSGTNPVILVCIALFSPGTGTFTVSSVVVSAGLTAGTPVEVKNIQTSAGANGTFISIWAIPAPSGTGTITVTLSGSTAYQSNAILMSGADQTTPCPAADAASTSGVTNPLSVTPANLTANDAAVGMGGNGNDGDAPTFQQTQTFNNNTTSINAAGGYHLGTGAVSVNWGTASSIDSLVGVRVAAASAGNSSSVSPSVSPSSSASPSVSLSPSPSSSTSASASPSTAPTVIIERAVYDYID